MSELYEKATPRPWRLGADLCAVHPDRRDDEGNSAKENCHPNGFAKRVAKIGNEGGDWRDIGQFVADGQLIVHAVNNIERLEAQIVSLRGGLETAAGWFEDYAREHYAKAKNAPDYREQHGREVKGKLNAERAAELRSTLSSTGEG